MARSIRSVSTRSHYGTSVKRAARFAALAIIATTGCGGDRPSRFDGELTQLNSLRFGSLLRPISTGSFGVAPGHVIPQRRFSVPEGVTGRLVLCRLASTPAGLDDRIEISAAIVEQVCDELQEVYPRLIHADVGNCLGYIAFTDGVPVGQTEEVSFALACPPP